MRFRMRRSWRRRLRDNRGRLIGMFAALLIALAGLLLNQQPAQGLQSAAGTRPGAAALARPADGL
ncbi:MAG: hypothetical protein GX649_17325 [Chloroflexi bacterium]|nr:hypothetical protein [Chloroflexota bacterium]